jgi:multiple sugar transport system substrate-binding protein
MQSEKPQYRPLYTQIRDIIYQRIVDSVYQISQELPSEKQLAEEFDVSISTIRQAVGLLVDDGLLARKQGKGTFVTKNPITIRFLGWLGEYREGEEIIQRIIAIFERKNPNIRVEFINTTHEQTKSRFLQMVQAGEAPDVVQIVSHWTSSLASMGLLEPLEGRLPAENLRGRFVDQDLQGGAYQNKLFSVAWGICPVAFIYNRELLRKAELTLPDQWTLNDFTAICRKIKESLGGQEIYAFGLSRDPYLFFHTFNFLLSFNAEIIDQNQQVVIDSPQAVQAFKWLKTLNQEGLILWVDDIWRLRHLFAEERLVFLEDGPWIRGILKEFSGHHLDFDEYFGAMENPAGPESRFTSWNYNHALAVSSMSPRKEIAAKFIHALTSDPEIGELYFHEVGLLPPQQEMLMSPSFRDHVYYQPFIRQLSRTRILKADNPLFEKVMEFCADAARNILLEGKEIEGELREKAYYLRMLYS